MKPYAYECLSNTQYTDNSAMPNPVNTFTFS